MRRIVYLIALSSLLFIIQSSGKYDKVLDEFYRPQFHFTPKSDWMGAPNGLIWANGFYHMFYQHSPLDTALGFIYWGHAKSKDLVRWEHLPVAVIHENDSQNKEVTKALSGSTVVDKTNVSGLQKGDKPPLLIFYTGKGSGQCLIYSNDDGITWQKYDKNPLISSDEKDGARNPKVFWYEPDNTYIMMLWRRPEDDMTQGFSFYSSSNLLDWKFESHLPGFYEHPDLVQLPVLGTVNEKRWVIFDGGGSYSVGNFDGKSFMPETPIRKSDNGLNYYGTQTWNNIPSEDGRVIQIAWMKYGQYPLMPFSGQMSFPSELALIGEGRDVRLVRQPVKEIELLHKKHILAIENKKIIPGLKINPTKGIKDDCLHIKGTFVLNSVNSFGFMVRMSQELNGAGIRYDATKNILSSVNSSVDLLPEDGKIKLDILIDRTSIEIFANDGKVVLTNCFIPEEKGNLLYLYNAGGELMIEKLDIFSMKSMYEVEKEKKSDNGKEKEKKQK